MKPKLRRAVLAVGLASASLQGATGGHGQHDWLQANSVPIPAAANAAAPPLKARLWDGRVILLGEVHGLAHGQIADLVMLKAMHRQAGVRYYLGEFDAAQADAFNQFLDGGERGSLDAVFAHWKARGLQWANEDFRAKLIAIAKWNRSLPRSSRIRFLGADEVQDYPAYCRWLTGRLAPYSRESNLAGLAAALKDPASCKTAGPIAAALPARIKGLDPITAEGIAALANEAKSNDREARIAANTIRLLARYQGRFYGLWGLFHVAQAEINGTAPMALQLVRAGVEVRSIAILNLGGKMMIPSQGEDGSTSFGTMDYTMDNADAALVNGIEPFAANITGPLTLFTLSGKGSPFVGSDALTRVGGRFGKMQPFEISPATAPRGLWADGVIISRGSPPTRPLP